MPDEVVRQADQIELVDMTPEALRRRMAHGNVYAPDKVDAALGNYFRVGNLTALRELALLWLADKVDEQLDRYRADHGIGATWETRERVVVALTGGPEGDTLIRRAARIAARTKGADLLAVHVARADGLAGGDPAHLARQRALVESLGGTYHQVVGDDVPEALLEFARGVNATQLVLGASRRGRLAQLFSPGVGVDHGGRVRVHRRPPGHPRGGGPGAGAARATRSALSRGDASPGSRSRPLGLPLLTLLLLAVRRRRSPCRPRSSPFLVTVVAVALVGGLAPALFAARRRLPAAQLLVHAAGPPVHHRRPGEPARPAGLPPRRRPPSAPSSTSPPAAPGRQPGRGRKPPTLSTLAGSVLRGPRPVPALLEQVRETFSSRLRHAAGARGPSPTSDPRSSTATACGGSSTAPAGPPAGRRPRATRKSTSTTRSPSSLRGHPLDAADRRVLEAFAAQAAVALRQERLAARPPTVGPLAEVDRLRTALLNAVSHDLRTPLASAKAAVEQPAQQRRRPSTKQTAANCSPPRTNPSTGSTALVENLLDMSRLQAGALAMSPAARSTSATSSPRALDALGPSARRCRHPDPGRPPDVRADPALLERALANLDRERPPLQPSGPAAARHRERARRPRRDPGHRHRPGSAAPRTGTRSSCRSSGSVTATTPPASASASRSHAAWSRPWAAPCPRAHTRAEA